MPTAVIYERHQSRPFSIDAKTASLTRSFFIRDATNEVAAQGLALISAEPIYLGLVREKLSVENLGGDCWLANWEYGVLDPQSAFEPGDDPGGGGAPASGATSAPTDADPLGPSFSFDTSGGTAHITQSIFTEDFQPPGAPNTNRAIGLTKDRVEGCDIHVPALQWARVVKRRNVKLPYLRTLVRLSGTVNSAVFYGFDPGTVLYLGGSGQSGTGGMWDITHKFAVQENDPAVNVGGGIPLIAKAGWDYLWVAYRDDINTDVLLQKPEAVYVERVYRSTNFAQLEIGV